MKIYGYSNKIYENPTTNQVRKNQQNIAETNEKTVKRTALNKINIPLDFKQQLTLNKNEQRFFENLYPEARKEIQRYMQSQNSIQVEKGKFIDVRG